MLDAIIVGAGHRAMLYASYAKRHEDRLRIVGVADPDPVRRGKAAGEFGLGKNQCWQTAQELAEEPQRADFIINGTMDHQHVSTSVPLLEAGYDMLLEKPFATNEREMWRLVETAQRNDSLVSICHVLRYAPFYASIRQRVENGEIGDVINVQLTEHVSYHHMAVGYVRGKWNRESRCHSTMLMAKSCHDLDLMVWMKSGVRPVQVASYGSNFQFRSDNAPEGAGMRCLVDCDIEQECLYSARKHYIDHPERWSFYVWECLEDVDNPTIEDKIESLKTDNPFGRCVWKCDNDVVDHQSVVANFEDGTTGTLNMIGGSSRPRRSIHLIGTEGEIQGTLDSSQFVIRHIDPRPGEEYSEQVVDLTQSGDMTGAFGGHGGGDMRLVHDLVQVLHGEEPSISWTGIEDSVSGHLLGFCADRARVEDRGVKLEYRS